MYILHLVQMRETKEKVKAFIDAREILYTFLSEK